MFENIKYREWRLEDKDSLTKLIQQYIAEACPDLLATVENAIRLWECAGMMSRVATLKDGRIIAFTLLAPIAHLDTRVRMLHAVGTYVLPDFRRHGIGEVLRRMAMARARELGYERLQGFAYTQDNVNGVTKLGGAVVGVVLETPINTQE